MDFSNPGIIRIFGAALQTKGLSSKRKNIEEKRILRSRPKSKNRRNGYENKNFEMGIGRVRPRIGSILCLQAFRRGVRGAVGVRRFAIGRLCRLAACHGLFHGLPKSRIVCGNVWKAFLAGRAGTAGLQRLLGAVHCGHAAPVPDLSDRGFGGERDGGLRGMREVILWMRDTGFDAGLPCRLRIRVARA